jgi:hypothetical protein
MADGQTSKVQYLTVARNHGVQDVSLPNAGNYYTCIDITPCRSAMISTNTVEGNIVIGSERDPHYTTQIVHNIIKPTRGSATGSHLQLPRRRRYRRPEQPSAHRLEHHRRRTSTAAAATACLPLNHTLVSRSRLINPTTASRRASTQYGSPE